MDAAVARQSRRLVAAVAIVAALVAWFLVATPGLQAASPGTHPFTSAVTRFILDNGTVESMQSRVDIPGNYIPTTVLYQFCAPPGDSETNTAASGTLVVAADGKLTGACQATRTVTSTDGSSIAVVKRGTLTGNYDLTAQTVEFHFEGSTQSTYTQPPTCKGDFCAPTTGELGIVIDGPVTGGEVVGDRAEGTARHTYTCSPSPQCPVARQVATAKFLIQFLPALATAAPGGGPTTGGGTPLDDGSGFDPLLLFFLLALLALVILYFRLHRVPAATPKQAADLLGAGNVLERTATEVVGAETRPTDESRMQEGVDTAAAIFGAGDTAAGIVGAGDAPASPTPLPETPPAGAASSASQPARPSPAAGSSDKAARAAGPPRPPSGEPGVPKRADLEMNENIILGAELIDPEKPPVNPADL